MRRRLGAFLRDHPFLTVFIVAFTLRLAVAVVLLATDQILAVAPDARVFFDLARGACLRCGDTSTAAYFTGGYGDFATYLVPVSGLFAIFGPSYFLGQLVACLYGAIGATATARLAREVVPFGWAIAAGLIVALLPSQVLWGAMPLRDSAIFATTACLALALAVFLRAKSARSFVLLALAVGGLLFMLGNLRQHSTAIAAMALLIVAVLVPAPNRIAATIVLAAYALFMPLLWSGMGVLGTVLLQNDAGAIRANHAVGAESAFVSSDELRQSDLEHFPDGLRVVLIEPMPWSSLHGSSVTAAKFEAPVRWLLLLGSFSVVPLLWRRRRVLAFPALYCSGVVIVLALAEGNFGTLERHRGEIVWPMAFFSVVGVHEIYSRRKKRVA